MLLFTDVYVDQHVLMLTYTLYLPLAHSSDSEDLPAMDVPNKVTPVKHSSLAKGHKLPRSPGVASPSSKDIEKDKHKDKQSFPSARAYKWTFQLSRLLFIFNFTMMSFGGFKDCLHM